MPDSMPRTSPHLVVLSSGSATRLHPWSDVHTKTLLPTCDGPLLARLVDVLGGDAQSTTVVSRVPRASTPEALRKEVTAAVPGAGVHLVGTTEHDPWSEVYALLRSLGSSAPVVLVNGDLVLARSWGRVVTDALARGGVVMCAQEPDGRGHRFSAAHRDDRLVYVAERGVPGSVDVEAIGLSVLGVGALAAVDPATATGTNPWFDVILPELARRGTVEVVRSDHGWDDLGSWPAFLRWEAARHGPTGCRAGQVGPGTALPGSVVMGGARVGTACTLEDVVVLPGAVVPSGAALRGVAVGPGGEASGVV